MIEFTTSTASSVADITTAAAYKLPFGTGSDGPASRSDIKSQVARIFGATSAASLTVTCSLVLVEIDQTGAEKIARFPFTVTTTAFRSPKAGGATGNYAATVAFTESGSSKFDLLGHDEVVRVSSATTTRNCKTAWYAVVESGLSSGSITLWISETRSL